MKYNQRVNTEINPGVMPNDWQDIGRKNSMYNVYLSALEKKTIMYKLSTVKKQANKKEIICFLLSNYMAYASGKHSDQVAINILDYGKKYRGHQYARCKYIIGSIPECFHAVSCKAIRTSEFRYMGHFLYTALTAFYYAPDRLIKDMCRVISTRKGNVPASKKPMILKTLISKNDYQLIVRYAQTAGMTTNELLRIALKTACMSKIDRKNNTSQLLKVFSEYRLLKQSGQPYEASDKIEVFAYIGAGHEAKCLKKFCRRRKITGSKMLRKAARAIVEVVNKKDSFRNKVHIQVHNEESDTDYYYEQLSRIDFIRSIYSFR